MGDEVNVEVHGAAIKIAEGKIFLSALFSELVGKR